MEKNCRTCKWGNNGSCLCKEVNKNISIQSLQDGDTYIEDGIFHESVHENISADIISDMIVKALREQDFIKKNKNIGKFDLSDIEDNIKEYIQDSLETGIKNYFNNTTNEISIENPEEFCCNNWE